MKINIITFLVLFFAFSGNSLLAQEELQRNYADVFIFDGKNSSFAWGRQLSIERIAIGIGSEGIYELRNDVEIWRVEHPEQADVQVANIITDVSSGNLVFAAGDVRDLENSRVLGMHNPNRSEIFDKDGELIAFIDSNMKVISPQGNIYLQFNPDKNMPDNNLAVFFVLYHYMTVMQAHKVNNR